MTSGSLMRLSPALPAPRGQAGTGRHCPRRSHRHRGGPAGAGGARGWLLPRARAGALRVSPAVPLAPSSGQPGPDGALRPLPGASKGTGGDRRVVAGGERSPRPLLPPRGAQGLEGKRPGASPLRGRPEPGHTGPNRAVPCRVVPPQACGGRCARRRGPGPAPRPGWRRRGAAPAAPAALPGVLPRHKTRLSALLGAAAAPGACVYSNTQPCSGCETMEINSVLPSAINRGYYLGKDALPPAGCSEAMLSLSSLPAPEAAAPARGSGCGGCGAQQALPSRACPSARATTLCLDAGSDMQNLARR